ncbi:MAG: HEAT repeat domain-containing protein [Planctomycetes bacterium]|nr:HEAT repeat domain-containing protein [Planctomycetota bacterium]
MSCLLLLFAACGEAAPEKPKGPTLPPPELQPFLKVLKDLAAAMPQPDEAAQRELRELTEISLGIVEVEARIRTRAERSLLEHQDAWFTLEPALSHEDLGARRRAAWLAGRTGQTVLLLPLLLRLKYENDAETVVWVADALQRLGNDTGLAWLDSAMTATPTAEIAGQRAIEICTERGITLNESPTYAELRQAMWEMSQTWRQTGRGGRPDVTPPSGPQLDARIATHLATTESTLLRPIDDARFVLTRAGRVGLPLLERTLGASESYLRTMALQVLAELGPCAKDVGPAVLKLLADPLTASVAVRALGELGEQAALPYLRPMLDSIDTELRAAATQALGLLGDEPSRAALGERMRDPNEVMDVRVGAAFALCCLGNDDAAKAFLDEREQAGDYHAPMLARLRERLQLLAK